MANVEEVDVQVVVPLTPPSEGRTPQWESSHVTSPSLRAVKWDDSGMDSSPKPSRARGVPPQMSLRTLLINAPFLRNAAEGNDECLLLETAVKDETSRRMSCRPTDPVLLQAPRDVAQGTEVVMQRMAHNRERGHDPGSAILTFNNLSVSTKVMEQQSLQTIGTFLRNPLKKPKKVRTEILSDVSGIIKPYTMTLVLGAPGSGKSTLLRTLAYAGSLPNKSLKVTGQVQLNGTPADITFARRVAFVEQEDLLFATLTVRETIMFSAMCRLPDGIDQKSMEVRVNNVLKILSLAHVADTIIGNQELRGVSGGEKRRVSIACEVVTAVSVLLMDAPSNGLDSSSTLDLVKGSRAIANSGYAVCMSLLQPSVEAFNMFDSVIMLHEGRVAFSGPRQFVVEWFEKLGYECPMHLTVPDFLQYVLEPSGKEFFLKTSRPPLKGPEFVEAYAKSSLAETLDQFIRLAAQEATHIPPPTLDLSRPYARSLPTQIWLNLVRSHKLFYRNKALWKGGIFQMLLLGFIVGTLFVNLPPTPAGGTNAVSVIFFSVVLLGLSSMGTIPLVFNDRPVFYVQHARRYYKSVAWFCGLLATQLPMYFLEVTLFTVISYWSVGFSPAENGQRFLTYLFTLFITKCTANAFMQTVSYSFPTLAMAGVAVPAVLSLSLMFCGFFVPKTLIPNPWIWMYYISFFRYPVEALSIQQLFDKPFPSGGGGWLVLDGFGMRTDPAWIWNDIGILIGFLIFFEALLLTVMSTVRHLGTGGSPPGHSDEEEEEVAETDGPSLTVDMAPPQQQETASSVPVPPVMMTFKELTYSVKVPNDKGKGSKDKVLLKEVTGYVKSGMMIALMGASGAGKSTLLDVLANRKTGGAIGGEVLLNGKSKDNCFNRIAGYVEQFDLLDASQTVYESVVFSALLRLPQDMSKEEKLRVADQVIESIDLTKSKHVLIGSPLTGGASLELRKRTTIAIELAARPSLLFLDEPTTGLDSVAATLIMRSIKKLSQRGQAVICTIHQPSRDLFSLFDWLLLLRAGGETAYFGEVGHQCATVLSFFEGQGFKWDPNVNPADFVLQIVQGRVRSDIHGDTYDAAGAYRESKRCSQASEELQHLLKTGPGSDGTDVFGFKERYATPLGLQLKVVLRRALLGIWRSPLVFRATLFRAIFVSLVGGTLWFNNREDTVAAGRARIAVMFWVLVFTSLSEKGRIPEMVNQRSIFYREDSQGTYRPIVAFLAWILSAVPYSVVGTFIFATIVYWLAGLTSVEGGQRFGFYLLVNWLWAFVFQSFTMMLSLGLPTSEVASSAAPALNSIFTLFCGFIIPRTSIPKPWIWMYYVSPYTYPLEALAANELYGLSLTCSPAELHGGVCPITSGEQLMEAYGFTFENRWPNIGKMCAFWFGFFALAIWMQLKVRHIRR